MQAIRVHEFGGPAVLIPEDVPEPVAGRGEVVVRMVASNVGYLDTLLRSGWGGEFFPIELPYVPGGGGAGRVLHVGPDVDPDWLGRRVVARVSGGYAEHAVAKAEELVDVPEQVPWPEAAALVHDGVTALGLVLEGKIVAGEWVLVAAATGGAGSLVVQLARAAGARVIAAARGAQKLALAGELGAEVTVDYSLPGWTDDVRKAAGGDGVALAFDGAGGELGRAAFDTVADGGRFITYGSSNGDLVQIDEEEATRRGVRAVSLLEAGSPGLAVMRARLAEALESVAQGSLRPVIGASFPLERAADAHASLEQRKTIGKSLLLV
ncbi:zinc-binding dehydrogenase [Nocardioidaceae bacterium SCSIO 66511]|nr:zinc-binding dehydrogenase [Nocardioidaceae bacterium SCSIO 66511]